ncbi:substrate-binding domain-containing protein [Nocardia neocaledoniensis]|uniref:substrate-binding domain-containing protein n=1 Tax=Nocardia neocaledoniensis TaxID=236511 RepID=UPI002454BFBF|nr:substrate-binding domain-containing protein [Nocardia neocaledoniensis]
MPTRDESRDETIEILSIVPTQGPAGIIAPSCTAAISLAVDEINGGTGILGREIRLTTIDGGRSPYAVAAEVEAFLATGMIGAITGWHTSAVRRAVADAVDGRVPYLYATDHEGLPDERPGVLLVGEHPDHQTVPAVAWMARELGVRKWAVIGNDYIWPRQTVNALRRALPTPADIVLEQYVPLGTRDFHAFLDSPALLRADAVLVLMVGADTARFNRRFAATGLPAIMPRLSPAVDENVLLSAGPAANANLYVASSFFVDERTADGRDRRARYRRHQGAFAPALTTFSNSTYEAVHLLRTLADTVGTLDVPTIAGRLATGIVLDGPSARNGFLGNQAVGPAHLARADGVDFEILDRLP